MISQEQAEHIINHEELEDNNEDLEEEEDGIFDEEKLSIRNKREIQIAKKTYKSIFRGELSDKIKSIEDPIKQYKEILREISEEK